MIKNEKGEYTDCHFHMTGTKTNSCLALKQAESDRIKYPTDTEEYKLYLKQKGL